MAGPQYPIYIPSKGRAEWSYTIRALSSMRVPFHVVVEHHEVARYRDVCRHFDGWGTVLELDPAFQRDYDACMELTPEQSRGPGPARNFAWAHAIDLGAAAHWVMDDNIGEFYYFRGNRRIHVGDGTPFRLMEDFFDRYSNLAMAGPNYRGFVPRRAKRPPFKLNTRIYSCNLIRNDLAERWRGRYNEDTILSLDLLKAGWCTVQFNAWLQDKMVTQLLPGGNTTEFYAKEGTLPKSRMLVREHPDVARLAMRWGREHHYVDYRPFANRQLIARPDAQPVVEPLLIPASRPAPKPLLRHTNGTHRKPPA